MRLCCSVVKILVLGLRKCEFRRSADVWIIQFYVLMYQHHKYQRLCTGEWWSYSMNPLPLPPTIGLLPYVTEQRRQPVSHFICQCSRSNSNANPSFPCKCTLLNIKDRLSRCSLLFNKSPQSVPAISAVEGHAFQSVTLEHYSQSPVSQRKALSVIRWLCELASQLFRLPLPAQVY